MNQIDLVRKFYSALPGIKEWIEKTLKEYKSHAVSVIDLDFTKIKTIFPNEILSRAKAVVVNGNVPFPPLSRLGLAEFAQMENMAISGITYTDTFFVHQLCQTDESLYFHELVHTLQWDRLGEDNFLLAYGMGLMQFGYDDSPLEKMAYSLQASFDKNELPENIVEVIQEETDVIWNPLETEMKQLANELGIDF